MTPPAATGLGDLVSRPRRSCHVVPGANERFLAKAPSAGADLCILDLEDAVRPDQRGRARAAVVRALNEQDWSGLVGVRINGWASDCTYLDVAEVVGGAGARVDEIVLPKVSSPAEVAALDLLLTQVERQAGLPAGRIGLEVQVETARSLVELSAVAHASPRLVALILGPFDLAASLRIPPGTLDGPTPNPLWAVHSTIVAAGRARGVQVIDGPWVHLGDRAGLEAACQRAVAAGYDGKWSIHPEQVEVINRCFAPTSEQLAWAVEVMDAYGAASAGAIALRGEMVDEATAALARSVLSRGGANGPPL